VDWLGRGAIGLALMAIGIAAFAFGLWQLVKTGSCASGGPYVSARPCPAGTGAHVAALIAGVCVFLVGGGVFATRGRRATDPGLPPRGDATANPRPLGQFDSSN
jgi:hypothetical protein